MQEKLWENCMAAKKFAFGKMVATAGYTHWQLAQMKFVCFNRHGNNFNMVCKRD